MARQRAIRRGYRYWGWAGVLPGILALLLLLFLPAFINIVSSVVRLVEIPVIPPTSANEGTYAVPRAVFGGIFGSGLACLLGLGAGWVLAGKKYKLAGLILLCLPTVIGESAAASAFGATSGPYIEGALPLKGFISLALFEAWRLTGPAALVATFIFERPIMSPGLETLALGDKIAAAWRRWRVYVGICVFAGVTIALMGAGHILFTRTGEEAVSLIGPAEPGWLNPAYHAAAAWATLAWPLYILAILVLMNAILRLPKRLEER